MCTIGGRSGREKENWDPSEGKRCEEVGVGGRKVRGGFKGMGWGNEKKRSKRRCTGGGDGHYHTMCEWHSAHLA